MSELSDIDRMVTEIDAFNTEISGLKAAIAKIQEKVDQRERDVQTALEEAGLKSFKGTKASVTLVSRWSVKMPKDPEVKDELREWLNERKVFDGLWTINHQSLNALFKEEMARCQEGGEMIDVPGLSPVEDKYLQFRKV